MVKFVNMPKKRTSIVADQRIRLTPNTLEVWRRRRNQIGIRFDEDFAVWLLDKTVDLVRPVPVGVVTADPDDHAGGAEIHDGDVVDMHDDDVEMFEDNDRLVINFTLEYIYLLCLFYLP